MSRKPTSWMKRLLKVLGVFFFGLLALFFILPPLVTILLPKVEEPGSSVTATPDILTFAGEPVTTADQWELIRPQIQRTLETEIYGPLPTLPKPKVIEKSLVAENAFDGKGRIELWTLRFDSLNKQLSVALVLPNIDGPCPVFIIESFSGIQSALPNYISRTVGFQKTNGSELDCSRWDSVCNG